MSRVRIETPSRLHFGLLGWGPRASRQFGGVGLMVDRPGLAVVLEPSKEWSAVGPEAERGLEIAQGAARSLEELGRTVEPARIVIERIPSAHVGLGVGTQLSLALARGLTELSGMANTPVSTLARLTGRGQRSGIGIHGFAEGGLIVDAGRSARTDVPTRLLGMPFPADWSVLLVIPESRQGLHGAAERRAFDALPEMDAADSDQLCRLLLLGMLPAVLEHDIVAFGDAISTIQEIVGKCFAAIQGGRYGSLEAESIVARLVDLGLRGVGQSSWGPTLYAFSDISEDERVRIHESLRRDPLFSQYSLVWTSASTAGARTIFE